MNPRWLSILQHTLGLDQYGQPPKGRQPCHDDDFPGCYRNHYCLGADCPDFKILQELVTAGFMTDSGPQKMMGGMHLLHATQAGFDAVKQHSPRPPRLTLGQRRWRHFRDVREVCPDLTFKAYLNAPWRAESEARAGI